MVIFEKDGDRLKVTKDVVVEQAVASYDYEFLLSQRAAITADIARNQAALAEIEVLIAEADKLGIKLP